MSLEHGPTDLDHAQSENDAEAGRQYDLVLTVSADADSVVVPGGKFLLQADFIRLGPDLLLVGPDGTQVLIQGYFDAAEPPALLSDGGALLPPDLVATLAGPQAPGQYAQTGDGVQSQVIGLVTEASGEVTVTRVDGTQDSLTIDSEVFQGDVLETGAGAAIAITFIDETVFSLGEDARMVLDELIFDPSTLEGFSTVSVLEGVFVFVSGEIAANNPDQMEVRTPVATIGVRGTMVGGEGAAEGGLNTVVLLPPKNPNEDPGAITYSTPSMKFDGVDPIVIDTAYGAATVSSVFDAPTLFVMDPQDVAGFLGQLIQSLPETPILQTIQTTLDTVILGAINQGQGADGTQVANDAGSSAAPSPDDPGVAEALAEIEPAADGTGIFGLGDAIYDPVFSDDFNFTGDIADLIDESLDDINFETLVPSFPPLDVLDGFGLPDRSADAGGGPAGDDGFNDEDLVVIGGDLGGEAGAGAGFVPGQGDLIAINDDPEILQFDLNGNIAVFITEAEINALVPAGFSLSESGVVVAPDGTVFFTTDDGDNTNVNREAVLAKPLGGALQVVASAADLQAASGTFLVDPEGLALAANGSLFINDNESRVFQIDDPLGVPVVSVLADAADFTAAAQAVQPGAVVFTDVGIQLSENGTSLFVSSEAAPIPLFGNFPAIFEVDIATGDVTVLTGPGTFIEPEFMTLTPNGDLLVVDATLDKIVRLDPTVAGGAPVDYLTEAQLEAVTGNEIDIAGIAFDNLGNLLVTDDATDSILAFPVDSLAAGTIDPNGGLIFLTKADFLAATAQPDVDLNSDLVFAGNALGGEGGGLLPLANATIDTVFEEALDFDVDGFDLAAGIVEGSLPASIQESVPGTLDFIDGDPATLVTGIVAGDPGGDVAGGVGVLVAGTFGVLQVQANGDFTYTLTTDADHSGGAVNDVFRYTVTDGDGDRSSNTLTIQITDDGPIANDDVDAVDENDSTSGNVIFGVGGGDDVAGADEIAVVRAVTHNGVTYTLSNDLQSVAASDASNLHNFNGTTLSFDTAEGGELEIDLVGGTLGDYEYTAPGAVGANTDELFEYVLEDGDGTQSSADLTVTVLDGSITGTAGNDILNGTPDDDDIFGLGGNDIINGLAGDDFLDGGTGDDDLFGGTGNDFLRGFDGADELFGQDGDDDLFGGAGDDDLFGGAGADTYSGGPGDDTFNDNFADTNTATYTTAAGPITASLLAGTATGEGTDTLIGIINLLGSNFDDTLTGNLLSNTISGLGGDDTILSGGFGINVLSGGAGNDTITGGPEGNESILGGPGDDDLNSGGGVDFVTGGPGADTHIYTGVADVQLVADGVVGQTGDSIGDFLSGTDSFRIEDAGGVIFGGFAGTPVLGVDFFVVNNYDGTNAPIAPGNGYGVFDPVSETLYADDDSGTNGYAVIATVPGAAVVAGDIEVVV